MSDYDFIHRLRLKIDEQMAAHRGYLSDRVEDSEGQMRLNQGIVRGLQIALDLVQQTAQE